MDHSPKDNRIRLNEFTEMFCNYGCACGTPEEMFNDLNKNDDEDETTPGNNHYGSKSLTITEFKPAWEYFAGWSCQNFVGDCAGRTTYDCSTNTAGGTTPTDDSTNPTGGDTT